MTKTECIQIMAMLGAFYSNSKNDPKLQAEAWYLILEKYPYRIAEQAVLHFAETDTREYATFPTVGAIVSEINAEQERIEKPIKEIVRAVAYGYDYTLLSDEARKLINKDAYKEWLAMDAEEYGSKMNILSGILKGNQQKMLEG